MSVIIDLRRNGTVALPSNLFGSSFLSLPNPDPVLRNIYKKDAYSEILTDSRIASLIEQRTSAVKKKEINIKCENAKIKDKITNWISLLNFSQIIDDTWQGIYYGFQPMEILWEYNKKNELLLPADIRQRKKSDFYYNSNKELIYKILGKEINCSIGEWAYKISTIKRKATYDNPYGEPLAARLFWLFAFKRGGYEFWLKMSESFATRATNPFVWAEYRQGASKEEQNAVLQALEMIQDCGSAAVPEGTKINFEKIQQSTNGTDSNDPLVRLLNEEISVAILGHSSASESTSGKLGSEDMGIKVREDIIDGDTEIIRDFLQKIIEKIREINGISDEIIITLSDIEDENSKVKIMSKRDNSLHKIGLRFNKTYFVNKYGFSPEEIEVEEVEKTANFTKNNEIYAKNSVGADIIRLQSDDDFLEPVIRQAEKIIEEATSYADAEQKLTAEFGSIDGTPIASILADSLIFFNFQGRESVS